MANLRLRSFVQEARQRGVPLSELFLEWEMRESGKPRDELWELMASRIRVMRAAQEKGLSAPQHSRSGLVDGAAHRMQAWMRDGTPLLGQSFARLIASALAVAEVNACMGRIVAAPTAGSCGVLPAVLFTVAAEHRIPDEMIARALFTAGGIGMITEKLATLSGAEGGCQAEVGAASAMAAGGLVEMMGGSPEQVDHAVAFAISGLMGLICDPVLGLVEIPCVKRNATGAANAVVAAEMALAGLCSIFGGDACIETMGRVGRKLPEEFRETAKGGLAALPVPDIPLKASDS